MSKISLLGVPNDEHSSYMRGPAEAPPLIRAALFSDAYTDWSETGLPLGGVFEDLGDLAFPAGEDPWDVIGAGVDGVLATGRPLISLGGDHAVTYPILRGVRPHAKKLTIVHIDAHPDIYDAYQGDRRSHASPFARIMEEKLADRLIQIGLRCISGEHRRQWERFGVEAIPANALQEGLRLQIDTPVYLSVDLDALDPAFAPGVSHREPGGLSTREVLGLIHAIDAPIIAADVVEYNPRCDAEGVTALVAAKLVKEIAGMMLAGG